jgi:outer membrane receptor protein involved in Fe transport
MKGTSALRSLLCLAGVYLGSPAFGQTASPTASGSPPAVPEGDPITLSPFTVTADSQVGYLATETLGGTRLKTELRDVAASLTVMTEEFMNDIAATSMADALAFTPSAGFDEGDSESANSVLGAGVWDASRPIRLRGFGFSNNASSDFFENFFKADRYNVESFTVSRGPNSTLFGTGGAAGVAIGNVKKANLHRRIANVEMRVDSYGSRRAALDLGEPVKKGVFALRLNALFDDQELGRKNEFDEQKRFMIGFTLQPTKSTRIFANFEDAHREYSNFSQTPIFYNSYQRWSAAGKPSVDFWSRENWTATSRLYTDPAGNPVPVYRGVADADGRIDAKADFDPNGAIEQVTGRPYVLNFGLGSDYSSIQSRIRQGTTATNQFAGGANEFRVNPLYQQDPFGFKPDDVLWPSSRQYPMQTQRSDWTEILVEQRILSNLFAELGYSRATDDRLYTPDFRAQLLNIDPNRYFSDGQLNPGYLQPFSELNFEHGRDRRKTTEFRATLSLQLDPTQRKDWLRFLGSHGLALLGSHKEEEQRLDRMHFFNIGATGSSSLLGTDILSGNYQLRGRTYFVDGQIPHVVGAWEIKDNLDRINALSSTSGLETVPVKYKALPSFPSNPNLRVTNSRSLAWQASWWKKRLVTLYGYRADGVSFYTARNDKTRIDPDIPLAATTTGFKTYYYADDLAIPSAATVQRSAIKRTFSAVLNPTKWLSLTANRSGNFTPQSAQFLDMFGRPVEPNTGETTDLGLRFFLFNDRVVINLNRFANDSRGAITTFSYTNPPALILRRLRDRYRSLPGITYFNGMPDLYDQETDGVRSYSTTETQGYEVSAIFNPTRNWRIALTGSHNENKLVSSLDGVAEWLYQDTRYTGLGTFAKFAGELRGIEAGRSGSIFTNLDPNSASDRTQAGADAKYIEDNVTSADRAYLDEKSLIGIQRNRNPALNGNVVASYRIPHASLRGFTIGGNARFRGPAILGYHRLPDASGFPVGNYDVNRPIKGNSQSTFGAMLSYNTKLFRNVTTRFQLNVDNLLNDTKPFVVRVDTDSKGYYGTPHAIVPVQYQLKFPRKLIFTSEFRF